MTKNFFSNRNLGDVLIDDENKKSVSLAYHQPEKVLKEMDNISWAPRMMPTPFVGSGPIPGQHGNAYINFMQFRSKEEIKIPKPSDVYRIFITGASVTYGAGAPSQDKTIGGYLGKILNNQLSPLTGLEYEVVTAANCAWSSTHERILIENKLWTLEPDLVISLSGTGDVHWSWAGRNILWFRSYADDFFLKLINTVREASEEPPLPEILEIEPEPIPPPLVTKRIIHNIKLASYALSMYGVNYVYVLQPVSQVTSNPIKEKLTEKDNYFQKCYSLLDFELRKGGIDNFEYFNISDMFDNVKDRIYTDAYHFGDKGNEMIVNNIYKYIRDIVTTSNP